MKNKILIIDLSCEIGHVQYNKSFFKHINHKKVHYVLASTEKYLANFKSVKIKKIALIKDLSSNKKVQIIQQLTALVLLRTLREYRDFTPLFLTYNTYVIFLANILGFFRVQPYLINHNNIDFGLKSKLKKAVLSYVLNKNRHIFLSGYISKKIQSSFGVSSMVFNHPIYFERNLRQVIQSKKNNALFIGDYLNKKEILNKLQNMLVYVKSADSVTHKNVIETKPYIENISAVMDNSKYVVINRFYNLRVSSLFFKSLGKGCIILMPTCLFSINMKKRFPKHIFLIENLTSLPIYNKQMMLKATISVKKQQPPLSYDPLP